MKTERVYSKNATYQRFEVLKTNRNKRYAYGEFWIEGVRNINEARKKRLGAFLAVVFARKASFALGGGHAQQHAHPHEL